MIRDRRVLAFCLTAVLGIAACSGTATSPSPSAVTPTAPPPSTSGSAAPPPSASASSAVTATIALGFPTAADASHLPTLLAIDELNAAGWNITPTFFSAPEVEAAALASGQVQFVTGAPPSLFSAIQAGGKMHLIASELGTAWDVVTTTDITNCDGLVGKHWALNSPGGATTSYANYWLQSNCTADSQAKIKPVYINGSQNRQAAMVAGQIDASLLTPFDIVNLDAQAPGKFHTLADFGSDPSLKNYKSAIFAVNDDYATAHPDVVVAFLKGLMKANADAIADPTKLSAPAAKQNITYDANAQTAIGLMQKGGVYDPTLALTDASVSFMVQFSQKYGNLPLGLTTDQVANFTYLQQAATP
jgi:ABC-type nitrate/sulfonate/bicarbonate transport system substrate-binding protein